RPSVGPENAGTERSRQIPRVTFVLILFHDAEAFRIVEQLTRAGGDVADGDFDDLDLATLPDDELVKQMHDDLYDGLAPEIVEGTTILRDRGWGSARRFTY